jgi:hypothetical protein
MGAIATTAVMAAIAAALVFTPNTIPNSQHHHRR